MSRPTAARKQPWSHPVRVADLPTRKAMDFALEPDAATRAALADALSIVSIGKLRFAGEIAPQGRDDWRLAGRIGATVTQACVVTLDPVKTRIDEDVARTYVADLPEPAPGTETEMPEDDSVDPLPTAIDLGEVMREALALALPLFPRAEGAEIGAVRAAPPGAEPLDDSAVKPFAGLAALRDRLSDDS